MIFNPNVHIMAKIVCNFGLSGCNRVNPFMPSGLFYLCKLCEHIHYSSGVWYIYFLLSFIEVVNFNANTVGPDQTPRSEASDLGMYCFSMSFQR